MGEHTIPVIETERLILRECTLYDAEDIFAYSCVGHQVGPMAGWQPHRTIQDSIDAIDNIFSKGWVWAMVLKRTGHVIGSLGFHGDRIEGGGYEIGYAMSEDYWGQGIMPEAARAVLRYAFEELGMESLACGHFTFNNRSRRVIEKLGFRYQTTLKNSFVRYDGQALDEARYIMTKKDYDEIAANNRR